MPASAWLGTWDQPLFLLGLVPVLRTDEKTMELKGFRKIGVPGCSSAIGWLAVR
jgi:hypothetical protein